MTSCAAKHWLGSAAGIEHIGSLVAAQPTLSRRGVSRSLCEHLNWRDKLGRLKEMACRKALGMLERRGKIVLPVSRRVKPKVPCAPSPLPTCAVTGSLSEMGLVELRPIYGGTEESRTWNALMEAHHPLGSGPLCGAQIRYLIISERRGVLGCLAVSAAAWRLSARDNWLGWSDIDRRENLSGIVCNSRFLILPTVQVKHLASHVLGKLTKRIGKDWQERYGYAPWLIETYVDEGRSGTSYRAANWIEIGLTAGRGRQDIRNKGGLSRKRVFIYPLCKATLERLCGSVPRPELDWVHHEFGGVKLGDRRLEQRLLALASAFFARPSSNIPEACGSIAATKAAYRFFDHKNTTMKTLLEPHNKATIERMRSEAIVLVAQDTSSLNYTTHRTMKGIGPIGTQVKGPQGLMLHNTLAFRPDGLPLGIIDIKVWARDPETLGQKQRSKTPIEEKESYKWLEALIPIRQAADQCPGTKVVTVADREADIYEFFAEAKANDLDVLIRAKESRALDDSEKRLWPHMQSLPEAGKIELNVPRDGAQEARTALMSLRFAEVTLLPPVTKKTRLAPQRVWAVWAKEVSKPPEGTDPLEWMLLSTVPVTDIADAIERVQWYARRWGIEVFHRILKSGCCIEDRQLGTDDRLEACLAIDMVVAWRIHHLTYLGRMTPDVPCSVAFSDTEWKAVLVFRTGKPAPEQPPTLSQMIHHVAQLGGFLSRKSDKDPGTETLWRGLERMQDIAQAFRKYMEAYLKHPP